LIGENTKFVMFTLLVVNVAQRLFVNCSACSCISVLLVVSMFVVLTLGSSLLGTFVWISCRRCADVLWNGMYYGVYWMIAMSELNLNLCNFKWFYTLFLCLLFSLFYVIRGILYTTHMHVKSLWCNTSQHDKHCSAFTWGLNVWIVTGTWKWFIKIETCCAINVHVIIGVETVT
jgi:hypothetical protein